MKLKSLINEINYQSNPLLWLEKFRSHCDGNIRISIDNSGQYTLSIKGSQNPVPTNGIQWFEIKKVTAPLTGRMYY